MRMGCWEAAGGRFGVGPAGLHRTPGVHEKGVVQVTISLPSQEGAGSEQGTALHTMAPRKTTAAQLLQVGVFLIPIMQQE